MNVYKWYVLIPLMFLLFFYACSEEESEAPDDLVFESLIAEKDTIAPGGSTKITATATGSNLEYLWSATLGDILGEEARVDYLATPCAVGTNRITCEITNGRQSQTKTIDIVVYE